VSVNSVNIRSTILVSGKRVKQKSESKKKRGKSLVLPGSRQHGGRRKGGLDYPGGDSLKTKRRKKTGGRGAVEPEDQHRRTAEGKKKVNCNTSNDPKTVKKSTHRSSESKIVKRISTVP